MNFKNLRIRAYLRTGVVSDKYLPLDGVLFYHLVRREKGVQILSMPLENNMDNIPKLPIKIINPESPEWYYACSFAQWPINVAECSTFKVKSGDWLLHSSYLSETKKIETSRGKYKNYHIKIYYRYAEHIDWFCVGDPQEICNLLKFCYNIGKNHGDGWGEVARWEVSVWPEDWSVRDMEGRLMRGIPVSYEPGRVARYGLRPSYWDPANIITCSLP